MTSDAAVIAKRLVHTYLDLHSRIWLEPAGRPFARPPRSREESVQRFIATLLLLTHRTGKGDPPGSIPPGALRRPRRPWLSPFVHAGIAWFLAFLAELINTPVSTGLAYSGYATSGGGQDAASFFAPLLMAVGTYVAVRWLSPGESRRHRHRPVAAAGVLIVAVGFLAATASDGHDPGSWLVWPASWMIWLAVSTRQSAASGRVGAWYWYFDSSYQLTMTANPEISHLLMTAAVFTATVALPFLAGSAFTWSGPSCVPLTLLSVQLLVAITVAGRDLALFRSRATWQAASDVPRMLAYARHEGLLAPDETGRLRLVRQEVATAISCVNWEAGGITP